MCSNAGSGGKSGGASNSALSSAQDNIINRMTQARIDYDRDAYRAAAADFANSLKSGDIITEVAVLPYDFGGGKILGYTPTVWVKNSDGTISRKGQRRSERETPEEWARHRWHNIWRSGSDDGGTFVKGDLSLQQAAEELSKIKKKPYSYKEY